MEIPGEGAMSNPKRWLFVAGVMVTVLSVASAASAVPIPPPGITAGRGSDTEMTFTGLGPGQGVTGFVADATNSFDPVSGYPTTNPGAGFTPLSEGFAGVIIGTPSDGSAPIELFCIDLHTTTWPGLGYGFGEWSEANVPRVGYVARILNTFDWRNPAQFPLLTTDAQRAAAVQAAIWYFSDRYVLNTVDGLHDTVATIANAVIAAGPLNQPPPPSLTITPSTQSGPAGSAVGPFTITSTASTTVTAIGANMFADAAATVPVPDGQTVVSGTSLWLQSTGPPNAVLSATAQATVPTGNVYLYDGNTGGVNSAQKLILAQTATLRTTVGALAVFQPPGSLVVTKTITGPAAAQHGPIVIVVTCNGTVVPPPLVIPAGAPGPVSQTYSPIAAGSVCTVLETQDGHTPDVTARLTGSGTVVTIPPGGTATADLTDTYDVGSLVVNKTITGAAAGQQGAVVISVTCGQTALADFVIPAGTPAGTTSQVYPQIPAGTVCTATETANGVTSAVIVTTQGSPQSLTIAPNGSGTLNLTNTYEPAPGTLVVSKVMSGTGAGQQSLVGLLVACDSPDLFTFLIPAGTPAGEFPKSFSGIPAGSTCTVFEARDGSTAGIDVTPTGDRQQVVIPAGGTAAVQLTNTIVEALAPVPPTTVPASLPRTGQGDSGGVALLALLCATTGLLLLFVVRRRHRTA
jgi:hypothetical protein